MVEDVLIGEVATSEAATSEVATSEVATPKACPTNGTVRWGRQQSTSAGYLSERSWLEGSCSYRSWAAGLLPTLWRSVPWARVGWSVLPGGLVRPGLEAPPIARPPPPTQRSGRGKRRTQRRRQRSPRRLQKRTGVAVLTRLTGLTGLAPSSLGLSGVGGWPRRQREGHRGTRLTATANGGGAIGTRLGGCLLQQGAVTAVDDHGPMDGPSQTWQHPMGLGGVPAGTLARLRGVDNVRPAADRLWCRGLREQLEDELGELIGDRDDQAPIRLTWSSLKSWHPRWADLDSGYAPPASWDRLLDVLLRTVFRQLVVTGSIVDPLPDALAALSVAGDRGAVLRALDGLGRHDHRRLGRELTARAQRLVDLWPTLDARWAPRTGERFLVPVAGGRVVLSSQVDLAVGRPAADRASVSFVTVTAGTVGSAPWRRLLFGAVVEALRCGVAPFQVAVVSTLTGEVQVHQVSPDDLQGLVQSVVAAVAEVVTANASVTGVGRLARGVAPIRVLPKPASRPASHSGVTRRVGPGTGSRAGAGCNPRPAVPDTTAVAS